METKKTLTKAQMQRRISQALVFVPRDKDTEEVYFTDKGLRLQVTNDRCVISTMFHKHVFDSYTTAGMSRPYMYVKRLVEIALENEDLMTVDDGKGGKMYSFQALLDGLKGKEDKRTEYYLVYYAQMWLQNIFMPLYTIGESDVESFVVYLDYVYSLAKNVVILDEHKEGMTNKTFVKECLKKMKELTKELDEAVLWEAKTDEEVARESMEALKEVETEEIIESINKKEDESKG